MANQDFEIKLKATGGAQSATEVQRAEKAISGAREAAQGLRDALNQVQTESGQTDDAIEAMARSLDDLDDRADRAEASLRRVNAGNDAAAKSSGNAGLAILELSRGLEDLQYGVRGVLNNIPSLVMQLGGTAGLAGVISLVSVAAVQLVPRLFEIGEASEEMATALAESQQRAAAAAEAAADRMRAAMEEEVAAVATASNRAADERTRALSKAELERVNAQAALETAQVDAAEAAGEIDAATAIGRRAAIRDRVANAQTQAELDRLDTDLRAIEAQLAAAQRERAVRGGAAGDARSAAAAAEAEAERLRIAEGRANAADARVSDLERQIEEARSDAASAFRMAGVSGSSEDSRAAYDARQRVVALELELERARQERSDAVAARPGDGAMTRAEAEARAVSEALTAAERALETAEQQAAAKRDELAAARELAQIERARINEVARIESETRGVTSGVQVGRAQQAADRERTRREEDSARRQAGLDLDGDSMANRLRGAVGGIAPFAANPAALQPLMDAIAELENGLAAGEAGQAAQLIEALADALPRQLQDQGQQLRSLRIALEKLEARVSNSRSYEDA